jgi:MFS family permease
VALDKNAGADSLDLWVLRAALVSDIAGYVGYTLSRSPQLFVLSGMATAVGGLGSATSQAVVTKHVPPEKVGQVLGAFGMLQALARTFGPLVFNSLFAATVKTFPQAIFVLLASIFSVALMFNFALKPHVYWESVPEEETEPLNPNQPLVTAPTDELPLEEEDQVIYSHT